ELVLARPRRGALVKLVDGGQDPRLLRRLGMQDAFGDDGGRREARVRNSERLAFSRRLSLRNPLFATGAPRPLAGAPSRGVPRRLSRLCARAFAISLFGYVYAHLVGPLIFIGREAVKPVRSSAGNHRSWFEAPDCGSLAPNRDKQLGD